MSGNLHPTFDAILEAFKPHRAHSAPLGQCKTCDAERARGNSFFPPHDASPRCESGKRPHCTCDTCF